MEKRALGVRLTAMRRVAGLTQAQMAAAIGSTQPSVARVEAGKVAPRLETLEAWVRVTGIPLRFEPPQEASLRERRELVRRAFRGSPFDPYARQPDQVELRELEAAGWTPERLAEVREGKGNAEIGQPA